MYELIKITERCYYIECPAKIGLIKISDNEVCLIDSGSDKDAGKKALRVIEGNGWKLRAIYNTHSHADHIGGNKYLQTQTGCKIYAPKIERCFTENPILESAFLYGANPYAELKHKFLFAQECECEPLCNEVLPEGVEIINLDGHSFDMVGFRTSEGVVYLADCLSSRETLDKYGVGFIFDVEKYVETLERVKGMSAEMFIPSHATPCKDISALAQYNIDKTMEIAEKITSLCENPIGFDSLLQKLFCEYCLTMNFVQHALVGSALRSYLTYLKEKGRISAVIENNTLLWVKN